MKKMIILMSFAMVTNQLQAKDQWVAGFSFGKWQATGHSLESGDEKIERKSLVSQLKDHQGTDADLMDEASLRTLAEEQKQQKAVVQEVVVNEKSLQKTLQQFFMKVFAFLYKK